MACVLPVAKGMHQLFGADEEFLAERAKGLETYCQFLNKHPILKLSISDMRKKSMKAEYIEAVLLVRVFYAISGSSSDEWQTLTSQSFKNAGDLEYYLNKHHNDLLNNIEAFEDIGSENDYLLVQSI